jgi:hypothetical protein
MTIRIIILSLVSMAVSGCSSTYPVAFIGEDGRVLTGVNNVSLAEGSFSVTDGEMTCGGSYDPMQYTTTISMPVTCNDGRKGIVRVVRDSATSGSGTVRLNDGYKGEFLFGKAASSF